MHSKQDMLILKKKKTAVLFKNQKIQEYNTKIKFEKKKK